MMIEALNIHFLYFQPNIEMFRIILKIFAKNVTASGRESFSRYMIDHHFVNLF